MTGDLNRKIKDWLCPVDLESMHRKASSACQPGTGLWFVNEHLDEWIYGKRKSRLLYLEGKCKIFLYFNCNYLPSPDELTYVFHLAGSGKTVLWCAIP